jgi:peptidoglycan/LPS O-acetylase OafA/YrhL
VGARLADLIQARDGATNNFDLIRLIAAILVLVSHAFPLSGSSFEPLIYLTRGQATFGDLAVCIFFFISGFLVTRSLERRRSLIAFAISRIMRLIPGLAVATTLCAIILGPLVTSLSLESYFQSPVFVAYFNNILLEMSYFLPGVFGQNPNTAVNGSLWTLEFEAAMYIALPFVFFIALFFGRWILLAGLIIMIYAFQFHMLSPAVNGLATYYYVYMGQYFLAGAIAYFYRDTIRISTILALACLAIVVASAMWGGFGLARLTAGGYVLLWLAYGIPKIKDPVTAYGDLSYGVYIYAFPVQQLMVERTGWGRSWDGNIALALPITLVLAALSWKLVEQPSLKARRTLIKNLEKLTASLPVLAGSFSRLRNLRLRT